MPVFQAASLLGGDGWTQRVLPVGVVPADGCQLDTEEGRLNVQQSRLLFSGRG